MITGEGFAFQGENHADRVCRESEGRDLLPGQVIRDVMPGVGLLIGSPHATPRPQDLDPERQGRLRRLLGLVRGLFDTVLVDCPPSRHRRSWGTTAKVMSRRVT
jgi:cellulose biosynthesis protein BcsQ